MKEEMKKVCIANDGIEFEDPEECRAYEALQMLEKEMDGWLNELRDTGGMALSTQTKSVRGNIIMAWFEYDVREHPDRYGASD